IDLTGNRSVEAVYLVEVEQSPRGCQAKDGRYYRRRNFENQLLEDYEVRELMRRAQQPSVSLKLESAFLPRTSSDEYRLMLFATVLNEGSLRVGAWKAVVNIPHEFLDDRHTIDFEHDLGEVEEDGQTYRSLVFHSRPSEPLFPGDRAVLI